MAALPLKPEYGPTLGEMLAPRWRAATPLLRRAALAAAAVFVVVVIAAVLTLENSRFSQGAPVPFSFSYRDMWRTTPEAGGYVRIVRRHADGSLRDSLAVGPLSLPPYEGELAGALPLDAAAYIQRLRGRLDSFVLRGEGKAKVNGMISAYNIFFTAQVQGREMYGRDALLLPERRGARKGVEIVMLTTPGKTPGTSAPIEVGTAGVLLRPLKSFSIS